MDDKLRDNILIQVLANQGTILRLLRRATSDSEFLLENGNLNLDETVDLLKEAKRAK